MSSIATASRPAPELPPVTTTRIHTSLNAAARRRLEDRLVRERFLRESAAYLAGGQPDCGCGPRPLAC